MIFVWKSAGMKKIDKLIIKAFIGPFILTTCVVVFIFLMRFLMLYFDDFVGKDLGVDVYLRLFFYFSLITVPIALPLSTLLASLMCFGNLGEYTELTAIKAAGIPIYRVLLPAFVFSLLVSIFSFWFNNTINPWANLKGYSLLWDVKTTKVTLDIKEGIFYKEIPGYKIKVQKKYPDGKTLKNIIIYDHTKNSGNVSVTIADSGRMETKMNNSHLVFELFNGNSYIESRNENNFNDTPLIRNSFKTNKIVFSLESFGMKRTDESQFKYHEYMKNIKELENQIDSLNQQVALNKKTQVVAVKSNSFSYNFKPLRTVSEDSSQKRDYKPIKTGKWVYNRLKTDKDNYRYQEMYQTTISAINGVINHLKSNEEINITKQREAIRADVERLHKFTLALACLVMFLIGASLGSIIKKGGFGMPVLLAISFFIFMYILMQLGDKYAKEGLWYVLAGVWMPDAVLFVIGLFLMYKATNDARLFDKDIYTILFEKIKQRFSKKVAIQERVA